MESVKGLDHLLGHIGGVALTAEVEVEADVLLLRTLIGNIRQRNVQAAHADRQAEDLLVRQILHFFLTVDQLADRRGNVLR